MYAPFGTGVLIGPKKVFANGSPDYSGGGTIETVTQNSVTWSDPPAKEEAGSPNVLGVVALISAIRVLKSIGMDNVRNYEGKLMDYAMEKLKSVPDVVFYGDVNTLNRVGIISFNIAGINDAAVANALSELGGIAVRSGCFCAQPYMRKLLKISDDEIGGMVRISFGI
jgi:selenocysteine lyase/cysteine desulfurase